MSDSELYSKYFSAGMRVGVGIPLHNDELFRDWAMIHEIEEDLVVLQLSRDVLPAEVDLQTGKILELRCGKEGKGYRCSGVYVSEGEAGNVHIRLTGDVNSNELREFYRIDAYLPFNVEMAQDNNLDAVLKEWRTRKKNRSEFETRCKEEFEYKRRDLIIRTAEGEFDVEDEDPAQKTVQQPTVQEEVLELVDDSWKEAMAYAINLSAGGFKFVTDEQFELGNVVFQEVYLPANPPRIMECVARVVFKNQNYAIKGDTEYFNIATQFLFIDERDRDAIVSHISNLELMRIRLLRQNFLPSDVAGNGKMFTPLRILGTVLFLSIVLVLAIFYYRNYVHNNVKNEIEETFESGIRKYLNRFKY